MACTRDGEASFDVPMTDALIKRCLACSPSLWSVCFFLDDSRFHNWFASKQPDQSGLLLLARRLSRRILRAHVRVVWGLPGTVTLGAAKFRCGVPRGSVLGLHYFLFIKKTKTKLDVQKQPDEQTHKRLQVFAKRICFFKKVSFCFLDEQWMDSSFVPFAALDQWWTTKLANLMNYFFPFVIAFVQLIMHFLLTNSSS